MLPEEKEQLLTLFDDLKRWCQDAEARDATGQAVHYDDPSAVAWDITGGMCLLFGWDRSLELFPQLDRHVHQIKRTSRWRTDPGIVSMSALQDTNDETRTTFATMMGWLRSMPTWNGHRQQSEQCGGPNLQGSSR